MMGFKEEEQEGVDMLIQALANNDGI